MYLPDCNFLIGLQKFFWTKDFFQHRERDTQVGSNQINKIDHTSSAINIYSKIIGRLTLEFEGGCEKSAFYNKVTYQNNSNTRIKMRDLIR